MIGFFLVDQALCVYIHAFTPSKKFPLKETLTHVVWGFLNTKTYTLVVLLHMMNAGVTIPIWLWALDAYFQVDQRKFMISDLLRQVTQRFAFTISNQWAHWVELFYHQHRMAHLPKVILLTLVFTRIFFQGVRARAQATPLPPWNSLFRRSHLRWVGKNKKTTISAFICNHSGNGMPEEFFFLLLELGLGIGFGLTPASLNRLVQCQWYFEESDQFYTV